MTPHPRARLALVLRRCSPATPTRPAVCGERLRRRREDRRAHAPVWRHAGSSPRAREADGFRVLTINVNYRDFPPIPRSSCDAAALCVARTRTASHSRRHSMPRGSDAPGWLAQRRAGPRRGLRQGAVAVKVWKDIGMQQRDADGRAVMIDDPRFDPLFDWLEKRGVPVLGHQGEPRNAWLPLDADDDPRRPRILRGASAVPHGRPHPEWPSYEQQIAARDRMLDKHPGLAFVGVHLASLEWDVDRIAAFLRRYPNASVDLAARLSAPQLQASRDRDKVRRFFIEFQDRILYGSDFGRGRRPDRCRVRGGGARGLARGLALPGRQRRAAFGRVRRAVSRARPAARRSSTRSIARTRAASFRRRGAERRERAMMIGAALLLLTSAAAVQGDGIRLEFDGADAKPRRRDGGPRRRRSVPSRNPKRC